MVDILKIKDENGDWVTVQAFQGQTGLTPHIQIGQVEAGATPFDAAASISGTKEFPLLNLTLPRGYTGEPGVAVASSEPQTNQLMWIDTTLSSNTTIIPEINDNTVTYVDTWSSAKIRDFIYPVGSIYLSVNNTSPATIFGGTWEQIQDTFLLAAGTSFTAGLTGGKANYTAADMPQHSHTRGTMEISGMIRCYSEYNKGNSEYDTAGVNGAFHFTTGTDVEYGTSTNMGSGSSDAIRNVLFDASRSWTGETSTSGTNEIATIMPPYLAIYVWKRTA